MPTTGFGGANSVLQPRGSIWGSTRGGYQGPAANTGPSGPVGPKVNPNYKDNANALAGLMGDLEKTEKKAPGAPVYTGSSSVNPMLAESYNASKAATAGATNFANSLADRSNESIINAMQRGRDTTANMLSDVRAGAGARGGGPGSGLSGILQTRAAMAGNRQNQATNAALTDVALGREGEARAGVTSAASAQGNAAANAAGEQDRREESNRDMFRWSSEYSQRQAESNRANKNYLTELALRSAAPWTGMQT